MQFNVMLEGQDGPTYDDLLAVVRRAENLGFAGVYRSDHYSAGDRTGVASTDAWATLAGLARESDRITLGTLVTPATFRPIGNLAKVVATVNEMAGAAADGTSRIVLGMGTGWMDSEHRRYGFPFEDLGTRFRRLDEQLSVLTRLWDAAEQPFDHDGEFVTIRGADFFPIPEPRPRIVVGGAGMRRTPALAARFADELNGVFLSPEDCRRQRSALDDACRAVDRDPATVRYSLMTRCVVGRTEAEFRERAARLQAHQQREGSLDEFIATFQPHWLTGTVDEVRRRIAAFAEAGVAGLMLQHLVYDDLEMLDVVADMLMA